MESVNEQILQIIQLAIREDIGDGDITSDAIISQGIKSTAKLIAKQEGILAGIDIFELVFKQFDEYIIVTKYVQDGERLKTGQTIALLEGSYNSLLKGERTALNFLQRMSGIATKTNQFVKLIENTNVKLLDTRKTVPGHRLLDKYSVKIGGGTNHRIGLFDMVMIKDNHIKAAGGINKAVEQVRSKWRDKFQIEVETSNLEEVREAVDASVDIIMLDNMEIDLIKKSVEIINRKCKIEVSGNVSIEKVKELAETGVDFISVGELTHSVKALDISIKFE